MCWQEKNSQREGEEGKIVLEVAAGRTFARWCTAGSKVDSAGKKAQHGFSSEVGLSDPVRSPRATRPTRVTRYEPCWAASSKTKDFDHPARIEVPA